MTQSSVRSAFCLAAATVAVGLTILAPDRAQADDLDPVALAEACKLRCGALKFAGGQTTVCFADYFLSEVAKKTTLKVHTKYTPVTLGTDQLFETPFCVWSGNETFTLSQKERDNLRNYLEGGGFIVASPGCSDSKWDRSFRREMATIFSDIQMEKIPMTHEIFRTVYEIKELRNKSKKTVLLEGLTINGRLAMVYSPDGLNDAGRAKGCCCCGGNEVREAVQANVNIFTYALLY